MLTEAGGHRTGRQSLCWSRSAENFWERCSSLEALRSAYLRRSLRNSLAFSSACRHSEALQRAAAQQEEDRHKDSSNQDEHKVQARVAQVVSKNGQIHVTPASISFQNNLCGWAPPHRRRYNLPLVGRVGKHHASPVCTVASSAMRRAARLLFAWARNNLTGP